MVNILNLPNNNYNITIPMIVCTTAKATAAKTCTGVNDDFGSNLKVGTHILLKLTNGNSKSSITLSINSGTAITIYGIGSCSPQYFNYANAIMHLVYDGTNWFIVG